MYDNAVKVIKEAILRSQYRAVSHVNKEQLSLYYGIGRYVSENSRVGVWGKSAIKTISQQLQKELPGLRGFSPSNIKNMRQFYEEWYPIINRQPAAGDLKTQAVVGDIKIDESLKNLQRTFTVDGTTYYAEEGMTWQDWIGSAYDTSNGLFSKYTLPSGTVQVLYRDSGIYYDYEIRQTVGIKIKDGGNYSGHYVVPPPFV